MKSPNKKINELVQYLPEKDKNIALKLIAKRDFNSLKELVDSCIKDRKNHKYRRIYK
mgnify:CR=1 FL=1